MHAEEVNRRSAWLAIISLSSSLSVFYELMRKSSRTAIQHNIYTTNDQTSACLHCHVTRLQTVCTMSVMHVHSAVQPGMQSASAMLVKMTMVMDVHCTPVRPEMLSAQDRTCSLIHTQNAVFPKGHVHTVLSSSLYWDEHWQSAWQQ